MNGMRRFTNRVVVMCLVFALAFSVAPIAQARSGQSIRITNAGSVKKLWVGQAKKIKITKKGIKGGVVYKSSNKKVVSVSGSGKVFGEKKGTATVTVMSKRNKRVKASVKITVKLGGIKKFQYPFDDYTWTIGDDDDDYWSPWEDNGDGEYPFQPLCNLIYYYKACKWSSSDTSVATIGKDGTVYAKGAGTTTLTCKYAGFTTTMELTIEFGDDDDDYYDDDDDYYDDDDDDDYYDDDDDDYYDDDDDDYDDDDDDDYYDDDEDDDDW